MKKYFELFPFVLGVWASATLGLFVFGHHDADTTHEIGYADSIEEVHVHSDFVVYLDGVEYDLSDDKYQSEGAQVLHAHIHLHDNNDEVIHRHDHDITLGDFFTSLGFELTEQCLIDDSGKEFCNGGTKKLLVFVNGNIIEDPINYVNQEEDQILVYFGSPSDIETINSLLGSVTDTACIYSGTCPERGIAPAESCGLTCEL